MFRDFKREAEASLEKAVRQIEQERDIHIIDEENPDLKIEEPREIAELASTIPFKAASSAGTNPIEIGRDITDKINLGEETKIDRVEFAEPGYINFFLDKKQLPNVVETVIKEKGRYGHIDDGAGDIVLEHTSANPTGPLHIGHLRNAVIGDTLARILKAAGHNVETHYYVNDIGRQMAILLTGIRKYGLDENKKPDLAVGHTYTKTNQEMDEDDETEIEDIMRRFDEMEPETYRDLTKAVEYCLDGIKQTLDTIGVSHDRYVRESKFIKNGLVNEILETIDEHAVKDGALKIEFSDMDKDLILLREDGTTVYALRDLAYHKWKSSRGEMLNVLGSDHKLYIQQLNRALTLLNIDNPESIVFEFVSLPTGKMSTREGTYISIDQLQSKLMEKALEEVKERRPEKKDSWHKEVATEVAKAAIRFEFTQVAPEKPITFNIEKAVSFKERGAPFIQYSHARATSILHKAGDYELKDGIDIEKLTHPQTQKLLQTISKFSYQLEKAAEEKKIHSFAEYTLTLASEFNQFYRDVPVLETGDKEKPRLAVVKASQIALENAIKLLGFHAPKEM